MATNDVLTIPAEAQSGLLEYIRQASVMRDEGWNLRARLEEVDRAYMRENDYTEEQRKAQRANRNNDPTKLQNMKVPMIMESVESTVSFLSNVFLPDYPMFKFGCDPQYEDIALAWNTLVGEDQVHFGWIGEFNQAFRQGSKYNFAPIEVDWDTETVYKVENGNGANGTTLAKNIWAGNRIKSINAYNTIYDARVPIHKVHEIGEFVGYIENMSRIQLKMYLASLGENRLKNDRKIFESPSWDVSYYTPMLNPTVLNRSNNWDTQGFNWNTWATGKAQGHINYQNMYTVVKLYARLMPFEFGIRTPNDQTPDIWKIIAVNGVLAYAQPVPNAHNYLPIIIGQPLVDNIGHQTKSQAENQQPFQEMTSSLWMAAQAVARRMTTDRMLYNPLLVDPDHINSPNPSAKIPMRPTAYGRKLEEAVYKIPFDGRGSEMFLQQAQGIADWGMRANGQNRPSVGQFQKGNKLQDEWQTTMSNANAREKTQATMWEAFVMQPIKTIIKSNYLQFTPTGKRYNRAEESNVAIDVNKLREVEGDFEVGDGLLPIEKKLHVDVLQPAFQFLNQSPQTQAKYEMGDMFAYMMQVSGADKLSKFQKTPEVAQYEQQLSAWQNMAGEYSKLIGKPMGEGKVFMPEDIQKAIGPMPQPPKTPAQIAQEQAKTQQEPASA